MQKNKNKKILALCLAVMFTVSGCSSSYEAKDEYTFANAGFERGTLNGWATQGSAFTESCVVLDASVDGVKFNNDGDFHFFGKKAGQTATGSMTSEAFTLKGNGMIGMLLGAGKDTVKCYVTLIDAKSGNELIKTGNTNFDGETFTNNYSRYIMDASDFLGKKVCIKVVDNDSGNDYSYINADDFIINYQGEATDASPVGIANAYVEENAKKVRSTYRHTYHAMTPVGWMNDPNGFIHAMDNYHFFFQFNPYQTNWGPMHWGHYTSKDLIKWDWQPVALAPDKTYDKDFGAFSGTALMDGEELKLFYTAVSVIDGKEHQQQAVAVSGDGINFTKIEGNPVITTSQHPAGFDALARDPKVFKKDGMYYMLLGARNYTSNIGSRGGQVLLYKSSDSVSWQFVGALMQDGVITNNGFLECPDIVQIDGRDVVITSPQGLAQNDFRYQNVHSTIYMVGSLNLSTGALQYSKMDEIDSGFDFYAAQTLTAPDGRTIMTAWMNMWDRTYPTASDGWVGAAILPRELSIKNNKLYQQPVREIENYRQNKVKFTNQTITSGQSIALDGINGTTLELELEVDLGTSEQFGVKLFKGTANETLMYYDRASDRVVLDRGNNGKHISGANGENALQRKTQVTIENNILKMQIFLDVSSVEVFLQDGERTMTANVYPGTNDKGIEFYANGGNAVIKSVDKFDIIM